MAHKSKVYLLDEITGGMDPIFRKELFQILQELLIEEDVTIIMSTHLKEEIEMKMDFNKEYFAYQQKAKMAGFFISPAIS